MLLLRTFISGITSNRCFAFCRSVEVQTSRLQNVESRRAPAARAPLAIKFEAIFGVRQRRTRGKGFEDVCQRTGSEFPLSGVWRDATDARYECEKAAEVADRAGERRSSAWLSYKGWKHRVAQGGGEGLLWSCFVSHLKNFKVELKLKILNFQNLAGARRITELPRREEHHARLPVGDEEERSESDGSFAPWSRGSRHAGHTGMERSAPGESLGPCWPTCCVCGALISMTTECD